jgi:membrane-associated phospholipid phosphatase
MFVWLWLACVAWRWGVPARRHLDFAADWWPALATLLFYTYTRGFADQLGIEAHVTMPIVVDTWLGGGTLPTQYLQDALCGSTCADPTAWAWYDTLFTATYASHFVCGLTIAVVLWLRNRAAWVKWMRRYLTLNICGLVIYVLYPMVPPWMASDAGALASPVERMTGRGGSAPGLQLAQLVMGPVGNSVAAMPSLHAGTACLVAFYGVAVLRSRWRWALLAYPLVMTVALVYFGEHYVIDAVAGAALAVLVLLGCSRWERHREGQARREQESAEEPGESRRPDRARA